MTGSNRNTSRALTVTVYSPLVTLQPRPRESEDAHATPKPWGREVRFSGMDSQYVGKLLFVNGGQRLSLQRHDQKDESIALVSGKALLVLEDADGKLQEFEMALYTGYRVLPGRAHRLIAVHDSVFVEASTPETGTTFRLADDYGRGHEGPAPRHPIDSRNQPD
mgnify:FL=1